MSFTLDELAKLCDASIKGERSCEIRALNTLKSAGAGEIAFLSNRRYAADLPGTRASAVILSERDSHACPVSALVTEHPYLAYAKIAGHLYPRPAHKPGRHQSAVSGHGCQIHATVSLGPHVVIGDHVQIGAGTRIGPGCVIEDDVVIGPRSLLIANITLCRGVHIGAGVILHPGAVIGADGFGFAREQDNWLKIPQLGAVRIGDQVEIGANTTVDRGAIEDTLIGPGVKIDNQVQIGHNVVIGADTAIAGCAGIAGSVKIGRRCQIGGACGISGHIEIADDVIITAMSGVSNSIKSAGVYSAAVPITDNKTWRRNIVRFRKLDALFKKILRNPGKE